ncbi:hypothetical protein R3P38DRAFT_3313820 [Favolaschia claudopus]|uniref:C2H2-type domain-containing protein n=1 Tax=Favolaschia claudopus TaxID=2862362 RepID=A0AAW0C0P7_9AGAR
MSSPATCSSCRRCFKGETGLLNHYRQTRVAKCRNNLAKIPTLRRPIVRENSEDTHEDQQPEMDVDSDREIPHSISDDESEDEDDENPGWEPPLGDQQPEGAAAAGPEPEVEQQRRENPPAAPEERFTQRPYITKFGGLAGVPLERMESPAFEKYQEMLSDNGNLWAPFSSKMDWEIAQWAKLRGSTSTAFSDLLGIQGVTEALGLSYSNSRELNDIIDQSIPTGRPIFERHEIVIGGEAFDVYFRPIIECIRELFGDPEFAPDLIFAPERQYADADKTVRLFHDLHTGKWWWETQKNLERRRPGATIVPVIVSTDKTQVTVFRNKSAYPVYLTIGNIPKEIRRKPSRQGFVLIGYLPTARLEHIKVAAARRRALANLYHACMRKIFAPLRKAGLDGIEMATGAGAIHRCHPIFAIFSGDYPEQMLVCACKSGDCPTCVIERTQLGDYLDGVYEPRDLAAVLAALAKAEGDATEFTRACAEAGIKPIHKPFWEDLPFVNIFLSITPDILHQLYQGVVKHVISWIKTAYGPVEIDARCRRLPPNHNTRLFIKGISTLSRISGMEHSQICRILLGLIVDLPLPGGGSPARLIRAVRAILDFLYHSQYPIHSSETVARLKQFLKRFHDNKSIFVDLGIRENFNIPKLHNISHYPFFVQFFGSFDNCNTETTERLHIDLAKDAYRATNRKDEYLQMTLWLERKEKIVRHAKFVRWRCAGSPAPAATISWSPPNFLQHRHLQMTKFPSAYGVKLDVLTTKYGASFFREAFARFVVGFKDPRLSSAQIEAATEDFFLPFQSVSAYHKIKFWNEDPFGRPDTSDALDVVHVKPGYLNRQNRIVGGRFDTVLVNISDGQHFGVTGYRVGQVRVVFTLSDRVLDSIFTDKNMERPPRYLAYVEWFSKFPRTPDSNHGMYKISRPADRIASIIPVSDIRRTVQLFPQFGPVAPREWTSQNVLELCNKFYVNPWSDRHCYVTVY